MQEQRTIIEFRISWGEAFKLGSGFVLGGLLCLYVPLVWMLVRVITFPVRWWRRRRQEG